jgi:hypothetical protein
MEIPIRSGIGQDITPRQQNSSQQSAFSDQQNHTPQNDAKVAKQVFGTWYLAARLLLSRLPEGIGLSGKTKYQYQVLIPNTCPLRRCG